MSGRRRSARKKHLGMQVQSQVDLQARQPPSPSLPLTHSYSNQYRFSQRIGVQHRWLKYLLEIQSAAVASCSEDHLGMLVQSQVAQRLAPGAFHLRRRPWRGLVARLQPQDVIPVHDHIDDLAVQVPHQVLGPRGSAAVSVVCKHVSRSGEWCWPEQTLYEDSNNPFFGQTAPRLRQGLGFPRG